MKKTLSIILSAVMLLCCVCGVQFSALAYSNADKVQAMTLGESIAIVVPPTGTDEENAICVATFTPDEDGCYEFVADTPYATGFESEEEAANGDISIYDEEGNMLMFGIAIDKSIFTKEELEQLVEEGIIDAEHMDLLACAVDLEAGKTYSVVLMNGGVKDYSTNLVVNKHTHSLVEERVEGDDEGINGIYEKCDVWFCAYYELKEIIDTAYEIEEGADQTIARGTDLTVKASGSVWKLNALKIDGEELGEENYETEEGSTIATVKAEFLDTLKTGKHTLEFVYVDGSASTTFTIEEAAKPAPSTDKKEAKKDTSKKSPQTGATVALGVAMMAAGAGALYVFKRERENA